MGEGISTSDFPAFAPNGGSLPYTVRYTGWTLALRVVGYGAGLIAFAFMAFETLKPGGERFSLYTSAVLIVGVPFCLAGLWRLRAPRVIFYPDRVEKPGVFGPSVLRRTDIKGVGKLVSTRYGSYFDIVSGSPIAPGIRLDGALRSDPVVADWLAGAPDPAAEAVKADRAGILADDRYGATVAEREARLKRTKTMATAFNIGCLALAVVLGFFGGLDARSLLIALAPFAGAAAIVGTSNGLVVGYGQNSAHPAMVGALAPILALAAHAALTVHLVSFGVIAWPAGLVGAVGAAVIYLRSATSPARIQTALALGAFAGVAAYGLADALNVSLDTSTPRIAPSWVFDAHVSRGRSTSYYLNLTPWSEGVDSEVRVSSSLYDSAPVGSQVCVSQRSGALGAAWFAVDRCVDGTVAAPVARTGGTPRRITNPDWLIRPLGDDMAALYPKNAQRLGVEGSVKMTCDVRASGLLAECQILEETPPGQGFGAAGLAASLRMRMKPMTVDGQPVSGARIVLPIRWRPG